MIYQMLVKEIAITYKNRNKHWDS